MPSEGKRNPFLDVRERDINIIHNRGRTVAQNIADENYEYQITSKKSSIIIASILKPISIQVLHFICI